MHLITGYSGEPHITSANDGQVNAHIFGKEKYVFDSRDKFSADIVSNNIVRIHSGEGLLNGRYFEIAEDSTENANIENGTAGTNRIDLIVARYEKDDESKIETMTLTTIKGIEGTNPYPPAYEQGNILDGVGVADFPLYKVTLESLTIKSVEPLFEIRKDLVTDVKENNANTLEAIKVDNQQTVEAVVTSNQQTLAVVDEKLSSTLLYKEIWTNPNETVPLEDSIRHDSINGYKFVEILFRIIGDEESEEDLLQYFSSGKIPVFDNNKVYTRLSTFRNDWGSMSGGEFIRFFTCGISIVGKVTTLQDSRVYGISNKPIGEDYELITDESEWFNIVPVKIIAFK